LHFFILTLTFLKDMIVLLCSLVFPKHIKNRKYLNIYFGVYKFENYQLLITYMTKSTKKASKTAKKAFLVIKAGCSHLLRYYRNPSLRYKI